ncbi:hypothetical protein C8Q76DRAFT_654348 [Earliella scabrosa]|nr:hypothetical protein C8Q76DRAFT_654348 [Earliella scabrosa]
MSSLSLLPPELRDHILDCLADDKHTLRRCALTTRSWVPRAQHNLFHSIYIDWSNCYAFTRILSSSPHLASHVATLEIEGAFGIFSMDRLHGATLDAWLRAIPDSFSHQLSNLTKLELALITIDAELVRRVFGRLAGISHLTLWACALTSFDVFVELLASYPRLTRLSIAFTQEWETCAPPTAVVPENAVLPQLKVVELTSSHDNFKVLKWLITQDLHRSIHTFICLRVPWASLSSLAHILAALSPSLQTLRVGFGDNASADDLSSVSWSLPVFASLTALTELTLDIHTNRLAAVPYTLFLISRLSVPALRTLAFAIKCGEFDASGHIPWARLAEASARVARATPLERVEVSAKERDEEGDGITPGGFAGRGLPRVDFVEMEMRVMEAFAAQGLEKLVSFTRQ